MNFHHFFVLYHKLATKFLCHFIFIDPIHRLYTSIFICSYRHKNGVWVWSPEVKYVSALIIFNSIIIKICVWRREDKKNLICPFIDIYYNFVFIIIFFYLTWLNKSDFCLFVHKKKSFKIKNKLKVSWHPSKYNSYDKCQIFISKMSKQRRLEMLQRKKLKNAC